MTTDKCQLSAKDKITIILGVEGHCDKGKCDPRESSQASPRRGARASCGCERNSGLPCRVRNGLLPPAYANRDFSYPRFASNPHPLLQCIDNQYPRKSSGDCWKSPLLMNPNVDTCKAVSLICQNPAIATP